MPHGGRSSRQVSVGALSKCFAHWRLDRRTAQRPWAKRIATRNWSNPTASTSGSHQLVELCGFVSATAEATAARPTCGVTGAGGAATTALPPPRETGGSATGRLGPPCTRTRRLATECTTRCCRAGVVVIARRLGAAGGLGAGCGGFAAVFAELAGDLAERFFERGGGGGPNGPVKVTVCPSASDGGLTPPDATSVLGVSGGGAASAPRGAVTSSAAPRETTATVRNLIPGMIHHDSTPRKPDAPVSRRDRAKPET
jgi:hypothetical protein